MKHRPSQETVRVNVKQLDTEIWQAQIKSTKYEEKSLNYEKSWNLKEKSEFWEKYVKILVKISEKQNSNKT